MILHDAPDRLPPPLSSARGSYNIMRVKSAFDFAYQQLAAPSRPEESLLQRILRWDEFRHGRRKRDGTVSVPILLFKS